MTISVGELFEKSELAPAGVVQWGEQIPLDMPGVYIVASTPDLSDRVGRIANYQPDVASLEALQTCCPSVTVDGAPATSEKLAERIGAFWIPGTPVVYVGLAGTSVRKRVTQYYRTPIGHRAPHAGGWWLKTLADLDGLFVHYAAAGTPKLAETRLLTAFATAIPASMRLALPDSERVAPFANVDVQSGLRKRHGMTGYKLGKASARTTSEPPKSSTARPPAKRASNALRHATGVLDASEGTRVESQVITNRDRTGSNLRIPARSKFAFPAVDGYLDVSWQGQTVQASWRVNGSRSGTLGLGRTIMSSIGSPDSSVWLCVDGSTITVDD